MNNIHDIVTMFPNTLGGIWLTNENHHCAVKISGNEDKRLSYLFMIFFNLNGIRKFETGIMFL